MLDQQYRSVRMMIVMTMMMVVMMMIKDHDANKARGCNTSSIAVSAERRSIASEGWWRDN